VLWADGAFECAPRGPAGEADFHPDLTPEDEDSKPAHRERNKGICIEMLYTDAELARTDGSGRRIFLAEEFDSRSGKHEEDQHLFNRDNRGPKRW
jgi:hypothetical protein